MARKAKSPQPDSHPVVFEGGFEVTPERWAYLQSLGSGLVSTVEEEVLDEEEADDE